LNEQEEYIKVPKKELEEILKEIRELRAILSGKQSATHG
jgi:carbon monoxide dehydrogenase subunit G